MKRIVVVGGGPAGMMAAIAAREQGAQVILLERNEKLGKKLYITGKGRCNLTNACDREAFFANIPENPRFLYSAFHLLSNQDLMARMEAWGLPLVVERGQRVFPASQKASDVTRTLTRRMDELGVFVRLGCRVSALQQEQGRVTGVRLEAGDEVPADAVILATGGVSYPSTGSTGDGYRMAADLGHTLIEPVGSLVPIVTRESWPQQVQGLSLKNVALKVRMGKRQVFAQQGELLFTHFGISGPLVLSASAYLAGKPLDNCALSIDLKPALQPEQVQARLLRELSDDPRKLLRSVMGALLPRSLGPVMLDLAGIDGQTLAGNLDKAARARLAQLLKALPLTPARLAPVEEAVITRGGVKVGEVDPKTMASKKLPGLFLAGELLDVDGFTGGFNLQIAFSTGYAAGLGAAAGN